MGNLLRKRSGILLKIESTYGSDAVPLVGTDGMLVENLKWNNQGLKMVSRPAVRSTLGQLRQLYGGRLINLTFDVELKGSGAAGTAPEIGPALRACGLGETIVASTSVAYSPVSTGIESATAYVFEDGKRHVVTGCRGNVKFTFGAGNKGMASFTLTGHVADPTDVAFPSITVDSNAPGIFVQAAFEIDGFSGKISELMFDCGNKISTPEDCNSADAYGDVLIVDRDVNGSINPLDELIANENWIGNFSSNAVMALSTGTVGTAGNQYAITMPAVSYRDVSPDEREGVASLTLPFGAAENTGDDEFTLTFT